MVDITAKLFWYRTKEWYENMADKLNDIVYTDDSKETVDVINLLLLGWILLGLIVYIIGNVIATQLRKRKATFSSNEAEISDSKPEPETAEHVSCASEVKSSAPEVSAEPKNLEKPIVIPTCSGDEEEIVDWINSVFLWIYKNRVVSPVIDAWISALNARTRLLSTEHGILIDFKDITVTPGPPDIQEAIEVCTSRGDLNVMCDMTIEDISFDITVTQVKEKDKTITPFLLNVKRISGKANIECLPEDLSFTAKYSEVPQIELSAEPTKETITVVENSQALNDVVCEICSEAFGSAIVDLKLSCYPECPRLTLKRTLSEEDVFESTENETEEKLLVKIIKASNLGGSEGCVQPYCVVEMDEPPQKFETQALEEKSNPFWDESFTFTVKDVSAELLFEIYDKGKPSKENFLGLGIVSVEELIKNPSQRQIIPLQSRPLEDDNVTGSLTTEFLFLNQITPVSDTTHLAQKTIASNGKTVETNSRVTAGGTVITTTTIKRTKEDSCGTPDAFSNLNANPIAECILTRAHETSDEVVQIKNEHNACLTAFQDLNGKFHNGSCIEASTNLINHLSPSSVQLSNGLINSNSNENGLIKMDENKEIIAKLNFSENDQHPQEPLLSNGVLKLACSPMHVHDELKNSATSDCNKSFDTEHKSNIFENTTVSEIKNDTKMHDIIENGESNIELSSDSDHYNFDVNSTLSPIAETVENSSASSKSLENYKGEHLLFFFFLYWQFFHAVWF